MTQYDNTNSGALFKSDDKQTANHPDYKGQINANGVEYWVSAWIKPMKSNPEKRFMSVSLTPKQQAAAPTQRQAPAKPAPADPWDEGNDVPF